MLSTPATPSLFWPVPCEFASFYMPESAASVWNEKSLAIEPVYYLPASRTCADCVYSQRTRKGVKSLMKCSTMRLECISVQLHSQNAAVTFIQLSRKAVRCFRCGRAYHAERALFPCGKRTCLQHPSCNIDAWPPTLQSLTFRVRFSRMSI